MEKLYAIISENKSKWITKKKKNFKPEKKTRNLKKTFENLNNEKEEKGRKCEAVLLNDLKYSAVIEFVLWDLEYFIYWRQSAL